MPLVYLPQADYPGSILFPANVTNVLRPVNKPKIIVLHTPEEPSDDNETTPWYFQKENLGASTHYYSDSDGDWYQMVPEFMGAIANGVRGKPYPVDTNPNISLNYQSVSVEIEGYAATIHLTCPRGGVQWNAVVSWVLWESETHSIPLDREHVIGHYEVANNRSDPGGLNIQHIVDDAIELRDAASIPEEPDAPEIPIQGDNDMVELVSVPYGTGRFVYVTDWRERNYVSTHATMTVFQVKGKWPNSITPLKEGTAAYIIFKMLKRGEDIPPKDD